MWMWAIYYLYFFFQLILIIYAVIEFGLMIRFLRRKKKAALAPLESLPIVTVQLPIYNEQHVIGRLIDAVCKLDYPKDKLEIQILDDSNDETIEIVAEKVRQYQKKGVQIEQVIRPERVGFKAGALAYGMKKSKGEFIAIFDADFVPKEDFLKVTLPHFASQKVGVVQTRWTHINEDYSLLTRVQAIFLNTHFTVEQMGRNESGAYINFNGTAGIWRRSCIEDGGGWQADTLTEDLDLSFRAQLKGWKFKYLIDQESPSELPVSLPAYKVQQFRWSKGAAECTKKNIKALFKKSELSFIQKVVGAFHLLNSSAYIVIVAFILLSLPLAYFFHEFGMVADPLGILNFTYLTTILLFFVFLAGNLMASKNKVKTLLWFPLLFPTFLMTSMGISLYLMIGVVEGYIGKKSDFVRTPKFNIGSGSKEWKTKRYASVRITPILLLELLLLAYCIVSIVVTYGFMNIPLLVYEVMFTIGLTANIISTLIHNRG